MITRIQRWLEVRRARQRYRLHLETEDLFPGRQHTYPLQEQDEMTLREDIKRKAKKEREA